jgi:alanyl-tRNA synthetase
VQLKHPKDPVKAISSLQEEVKNLQKETEQLIAAQANALKKNLLAKAEKVNGITLLTARLPIQDSAALKNLAYQLDAELENAVIVFGAEVKGKPQLLVAINKSLTESNSALHAGQLIRELAKEIKGGGGGQPFFATAGGKDAGGLDRALEKAREMVAGQLA